MILFEIFIYAGILLRRILERWASSPPINTVIGFAFGVLVDMRIYLCALLVLVIMDMITGIMASLHRGEKFNSRKLRTGLLERIILYGFLFIITLMLDTILRGTINYGKYYIAILCCTIIAFYEAGSCIENLVSRFPKYPFLKRLGGKLNLLQDKYEESTINKLTNIMEATEDEK